MSSVVIHRVLATHEEPQVTSLGAWPGDDFLGIALPSVRALRKRVMVRYKDLQCITEVADVGPWCVDDDAYVFGEAKPRAEEHRGRYCPRKEGSRALATVPDGFGGWIGVAVCNGAAIDLFPGTAKALGIEINQNVYVDWWFV